MSTQTRGATASFTFNGTSIEVKGAKRNNHGNYTVELDGNIVAQSNGFSDPPQFQVDLFARHNLSEALHTVVLRNSGLEDEFLDIDCVRPHRLSQTGLPLTHSHADSMDMC